MIRNLAIKENFLSFLAVVWLTVFSANAVPDDTEIFIPPPGNPKVLFLLDASGSMSERDGGEETRLDRLKQAMQALLSDKKLRDVDIGLMRFSAPEDEDTSDLETPNQMELIYPVSDVVTDRDELIAATNSIVIGTSTPTVAAMHEARLYLRGDAPLRGATFNGTPAYESPVSGECDSTHIILLSDGRPSADAEIVDHLNAAPYEYDCALAEGVGDPQTRGQCGVELVDDIFMTDQFPELEGDQNISVYTIGFNSTNQWFIDLAGRGGGLYKDAASTEDLLSVFSEILRDVTKATAASAPAVPLNSTNESRDGNELYYSLFQSNNRPRWEGNVKKYLLKDGIIVDADGTVADGVIVDANDNPVIVDGAILPSSQSLWSVPDDGSPVGDAEGQLADGGSVSAGGMAALQPATRKWYTDEGIIPQGDGEIVPKLVTGAADISNESLGVADDAEAEIVVQWGLGADSIDRDGNDITTEANRFVADSLHSSPVVITYEVNPDTDVKKQALFIANNMGVLHAIDPEDGTELWSYTPEELLPNIKAYVDNRNTRKHTYGLDGQTVVNTSRTESPDGTLVTDKAWLYLSQRRGGNNIFALDVSNALDEDDPFKVMWKIKGGVAGTDFRDLAQTWSTPQLINIKQGCPDNCNTREVLLFSGGYNADVYDNRNLNFPVTNAPDTGHGNAIYMVDPETGDLLWSAGGGVHHALELPVRDSVPETPVPVDNDADGAIDILFFSDIGGHVWRVDIGESTNTGNNLSDLAIDGGMIADLNEQGQSLRFFNRPDVVLNGTTLGVSSFSIVLGSGMRSSPLFVEPDNNRVFAINDPWPFSQPPESENSTTGRLEYRYAQNQNQVGDRSVITPARLLEFEVAYSNPDGGPLGFYRELARGEKILEESLTHAGRVFVASYAPVASEEHCDPAFGESRLYVLDLLNGDNLLPDDFGDPYLVISSGIAPPIDIVDTGGAGGPSFIVGTEAISLHELLQPEVPNTFRRFVRTGWIELDD